MVVAVPGREALDVVEEEDEAREEGFDPSPREPRSVGHSKKARRARARRREEVGERGRGCAAGESGVRYVGWGGEVGEVGVKSVKRGSGEVVLGAGGKGDGAGAVGPRRLKRRRMEEDTRAGPAKVHPIQVWYSPLSMMEESPLTTRPARCASSAHATVSVSCRSLTYMRTEGTRRPW